ncbi:MAG TPA: hypothetical protein VD789_00095 [Thermomicrobiales bacterium]|nr:hypothetical protein [Thermomicrobiales bacterium]
MAKNGWCTHPKRQHTTDVKILVRAGELACRNSWGGDLFQSKTEDNQQTQPDIAADLPGSYQEPAASRDDEVTSVITPPDRQSFPAPVEEDRVVSDRPAPLRDDDDPYNDAARHDQDERARIIARGNRDALLRARERHSHRRKRTSDDPGTDDEGEGDVIQAAPGDRVSTRQVRFTDRFHTPQDTPPAVVRDDPVPRAEVERRWQAPVDRFDSVPEVDPSFDLPAWRSQDRTPSTSPASDRSAVIDDASSAPDLDPAPVSTYEHVLQRARRVREGKLHKSARPIRHARTQAHRSHQRATDPAPNDHDHVDFSTWVPEQPVRQGTSTGDQGKPDRWSAHTLEEPAEAAVAHQTAGETENRSDPSQHDPEYLDEEDWGYAASDDDTVEAEAEPSHAHGYFGQRSRKRGGWLSHFGLGRRRESETYDDSIVTRHAEAFDSDDAWEDEEDEYGLTRTDSAELDDQFHGDESDEPDSRYDRGPWSSDDAIDAHALPAAIQEDIQPRGDVAYDNMYDDEASLGYLDGSDEAYDMSATAQPAPRRAESWHRQRQVLRLPDLDDNLFEETFDRRRAPSPTATLDRAPASEEPARAQAPAPGATSDAPSESYFRAARFRDWRESHPGARQVEIDDSHEPEAPVPGVLPDIAEPQFDLRDIVARGTELMDMTIDIAPDVPRECRTCRSFRSADGGARGWCTNEWAFTHRRMVNEDDLACETTIGCWWLPADRYWLIEDQDGYAVPTPRMDELIARHSRPQERRLAGSGA